MTAKSILITEELITALKSNLNQEVMRNIVQFEAAERFEEAARRVDRGDFEGAKLLIQDNCDYMEGSFQWVTPDSTMLRQYDMNKTYGLSIDDIEEKSAEEVKMMQKSNKSLNYSIRKKKE